MDSYGWKIKIWKFDNNNIEEKRTEMKNWMEKWKHKYQFREVFVCNAWATEYKLLLKQMVYKIVAQELKEEVKSFEFPGRLESGRMNSIEEEIRKAYPFWYSLSNKEKEIVNSIAIQIPISCEDVAIIFLLHGEDRQKTVDCIYQKYGFIVNQQRRMSVSNKLKKAIKNKWVSVKGVYQSANGVVIPTMVNCIITNDENGKTLSIGTDQAMFSIHFEAIEQYLKQENEHDGIRQGY